MTRAIIVLGICIAILAVYAAWDVNIHQRELAIFNVLIEKSEMQAQFNNQVIYELDRQYVEDSLKRRELREVK